MRKLVYFLAAVFSVLFLMNCKGIPAQPGNPESREFGETDDAADQEKDKALLLDIYDHYQGIVLDGAKEYIVKTKDTLSDIAKSNYGEGTNGYYFPLIMFASKVIVSDPDKISPGQKLTIPDLQKNLDDKLARSHLKSMLLDIAFIYDNKADHSKGALKARNQRDRDGLVALSRSL
jgi:hypothetical protein